MTWPLTQPPSSEERKATTRATSSGVAQRLRGQCSAIMFSMVAAGMSGVPPGNSGQYGTNFFDLVIDHDGLISYLGCNAIEEGVSANVL